MRHSHTKRIYAVAFVLALLTSSAGYVAAQTRLKPGMNLFSLRDDVEIGRRSAAQIDSQYRTYNDARVSRIGRQLAARSSMPNLPWRFRVVDRPDANAFALPGGYIYITTGMLRRTRNDSELAGILAHEITHVTLRHGTNQASKSNARENAVAGTQRQAWWRAHGKSRAAWARVGAELVVSEVQSQR